MSLDIAVERAQNALTAEHETIIHYFHAHNLSQIPDNPKLFARAAITTPLACIQAENDVIKRKREAQKDWKEARNQAMKLHAELETAAFPRHPSKDETNYEKVWKPDYLYGGDYFPGAYMDLEDELTWSREKIHLKKDDPEIHELLLLARTLAAMGERPIIIAYSIYQRTMTVMKNDQDIRRPAVTVVLGDLVREGQGVCRHRASYAQLGLQEAGITSTVVRGTTGGRHVWNEAVFDGETYIIDPMQKTFGPKKNYSRYQTPPHLAMAIWRRI
ncbi:hypothetical protein HY489_04945 [Candidatus Woesearchaeota archaeon]|nr:hypothetical protein [Candidatus Woesearchaeota archaeon]